MDGSSIVRGRKRPKKIIGETIKWDLDLNGLNMNIIYDKILSCFLIYIADPT